MDRNETSRRRFLAGLGAGSLALGVGLPAAVAAQEEDDSDAGAEAAGDEGTAALVETLELAAATFYDAVVRGGKIQNAATLALLVDIARHHREHAGQFGDIAGGQAVGEPNRRLLQTFLDQLEQKQSEAEVLRLAHDLETALTSTHLSEVANFEDAASVSLAASVLPVEAQHATAVARAAGLQLNRAVPRLENLDLALDVTQFPATATTATTTTA